MRILLSRTDSIGDVALTLPLISVIKQQMPGSYVYFLGTTYTQSVVACNDQVDGFVNWDVLRNLPEKEAIRQLHDLHFDACLHVFPRKEIARLVKRARIGRRIGTSGRLYHLATCNKLIRFSRKRSDLHEAQLNMKLLKGLGIRAAYSLEELSALTGFTKIPPLLPEYARLLGNDRFNLILHPTSKGSAVEWGLANFCALVELLPKEKFRIFVTGTPADRDVIGPAFNRVAGRFEDMTGRLTLGQLIAFINQADGLIAGSTGPLHLAGLMNKFTIGLFSRRRPIHPGRWAPLGKHSLSVVSDHECTRCTRGEMCHCIVGITPDRIKQALYSLADIGH